MEKRIFTLCVIGLTLTSALTISGCSLLKKSDTSETTADQVPAPDAQTDAVPVASAEAPSPADTALKAAPAAVEPHARSEANVQAQPAVSGEESYTVQDGDTLMKIAYESYGDLYQWKKILEDNKDKITNANHLPKGTVLKIQKSGPVEIARNGEKYLIKSGDTLGVISGDVYGTPSKWRKLWENNKQLIKDPNRIFAGFFLYYSMTTEEKSQAEELKRGLTTTPAPLAVTPAVAAPVREPSSATGSATPAATGK